MMSAHQPSDLYESLRSHSNNIFINIIAKYHKLIANSSLRAFNLHHIELSIWGRFETKSS